MMGLMIGHIFMEDLEHETSSDHVLNMTTWYDLRNNLEKGRGIDKAAQRQLEKEKEHWRKSSLQNSGYCKISSQA